MRTPLAAFVCSLAVTLASSAVRADAAVPEETAGIAANDTFAVTGVRVFDGDAVIHDATVVVSRGEIRAVGRGVHVPPGARVIDGSGSTLMPGLIDAHAHAWERDDLVRAARFGVTTELDMWTSRGFARRMSREQERDRARDRADHFSAISPATLREGYPYNFTPDIVERPTLSGPEEAAAFVEHRLADGAHHIKLMVEDGSLTFLDLPVPTRETVQALTDAAHAFGVLTVAHVTKREHARDVIRDGIDGLAHVFVDAPATPGFVSLARQKGIFVVATLNAEESFITTQGGASILADPELSPYLGDLEIESLLTPGPPSILTLENLQIAKDNVLALHSAGVPILAGTDVYTHGVSLHRDLELLVEAGLTPREALVAATSASAAAFGLGDRGRIAPGMRADLVLVQGNPLADIKATRAIRKIWKGGVEIDRTPPPPNASLDSLADRVPELPHLH